MLIDLRYAFRLLLKSPWFTALTVLVLAGGLAISVYTYAALSMMVYRDLPLPDGGRIVRIGYGEWPNVEPLDTFELAELRANSQTVEELGVFRESRALVGESGASRSVLSVESDWRILAFTRVLPLLGRGFVEGDAAVGAEPVAVIGYATWAAVFAGDAGVVGTLARINGRLTRIVGVMPEGFAFPRNKGIWLPFAAAELEPTGYSGDALSAYARLRAGVSGAAAEAELSELVQRLRRAQPAADERDAQQVSVMSFQEESWGVFGTVVFGVLNLLALSILLLAAVNIGNLLLARTNARMQEIGVRVALGAPRVRLIAQTALENVILCALGGALAIFLAARGLDLTSGFMRTLLGDNMPFWWTWSLDDEVVLAACVLLALTVAVVSVLPAFSVSRADPNALLKDDSRTGGLETGRISRLLVTVQVALISAVMLVGSAVTLIAGRATGFDWGMDTANLYMLGVELPEDRYATVQQRAAFHDAMLTELRATPGVEAAAVMREAGAAPFAAQGAEYTSPNDRPGAWLVVMSEAPEAIGSPLIEGRRFDGSDTATSVKTALVSRTLAREQWPGRSPLGETIEIGVGENTTEERVVVGVVGDIAFDPVGMTPAGNAAIYVPLPQRVLAETRFTVRYLGAEAAARSALYEALARVDSTIAPNIQTYDSAIDRITLFARAITKLFAGCGAFAILLAVTGIYGMSSNAVVLRTREIGLRRALGASNRNVIALFLRHSVRTLSVGLSLSALLSIAVLAVISQGFSIGASDMALIGGAVVVVISVTVLLSVYVSVRSAIRLDPSSALRHG